MDYALPEHNDLKFIVNNFIKILGTRFHICEVVLSRDMIEPRSPEFGNLMALTHRFESLYMYQNYTTSRISKSRLLDRQILQ